MCKSKTKLSNFIKSKVLIVKDGKVEKLSGHKYFTHKVVNVYTNEDFVIEEISKNKLIEHISYNKTMRFGRAIFVDGKCVHKGYLTKDQIKQWEVKLEKEIPYV